VTPPSAARRDRWSAIGLAALALGYLLAGRRYPLDTLATPGPGVFPLAAGIALLALAVSIFLAAGRRPSPGPLPTDAPWTRGVLIMAAALVLYAVLLPVLGFLATSFALVVIAARLMGLAGWWRPVALGLGVALAGRVIFASWLGVRLP
jgi:putative tricarboxylic transport membrane protein